MDWQAIIDYVGVPAIFKDNHVGGRRGVFRVHNVDELIQRYDESGSLTKILQEIIESEEHVHSFVIGQEQVLSLRYSLNDGRYQEEILDHSNDLGKKLAEDALQITQAYEYDVNMVEFVIKDGTAYVINGTNPISEIDHTLMSDEQFQWLVTKTAAIAIERAKRPLPQSYVFNQQ